jgi:hypothetical protein
MVSDRTQSLRKNLRLPFANSFPLLYTEEIIWMAVVNIWPRGPRLPHISFWPTATFWVNTFASAWLVTHVPGSSQFSTCWRGYLFYMYSDTKLCKHLQFFVFPVFSCKNSRKNSEKFQMQEDVMIHADTKFETKRMLQTAWNEICGWLMNWRVCSKARIYTSSRGQVRDGSKVIQTHLRVFHYVILWVTVFQFWTHL